MQAQSQRLPGVESAAAEVRRRVAGTRDRDRLATLQCGTPDDAPTSNRLVREPAGAGHEVLAFAERQLVTTAEMEDVAHVEVRQAIVERHSEARHPGRAVARNAASVEQVTRIRHRLGIRISEKE